MFIFYYKSQIHPNILIQDGEVLNKTQDSNPVKTKYWLAETMFELALNL